MPTTYASILAAQIAAIQAISPSARSDRRFEVYGGEEDFDVWVDANPRACWRRFDIQNGIDYEPTDDLTNAGASGSLHSMQHTSNVLVAYPREWGKYGAGGNARNLDIAIDVDLAQIDFAIGADAQATSTWPTGLTACRRQSVSFAKLTGAYIVTARYQLLYDRSY